MNNKEYIVKNVPKIYIREKYKMHLYRYNIRHRQ